MTDLPSKSRTIHVALLDEGVDVWRPVEAIQEREDVYRIVSETPDDEKWAFATGSRVRCRERELSGDFGTTETVLVAYEAVPAVG